MERELKLDEVYALSGSLRQMLNTVSPVKQPVIDTINSLNKAILSSDKVKRAIYDKYVAKDAEGNFLLKEGVEDTQENRAVITNYVIEEQEKFDAELDKVAVETTYKVIFPQVSKEREVLIKTTGGKKLVPIQDYLEMDPDIPATTVSVLNEYYIQ